MVIGNTIFCKQRPFFEILIPVTKLHVEATIYWFIVHLIVKAFPVGHSTLPLGSARYNIHLETPFRSDDFL
jgi:hypothetical protein